MKGGAQEHRDFPIGVGDYLETRLRLRAAPKNAVTCLCFRGVQTELDTSMKGRAQQRRGVVCQETPDAVRPRIDEERRLSGAATADVHDRRERVLASMKGSAQERRDP
jgi:hypothetical protein